MQDVSAVARAMKLGPYAVLGHSYGALVALQHAVSFPGDAGQTIVSNGVPSMKFLWEHVERSLREFEPAKLREQSQEQFTTRCVTNSRCALSQDWKRKNRDSSRAATRGNDRTR